MHEALLEPTYYGDLVYKFSRVAGTFVKLIFQKKINKNK